LSLGNLPANARPFNSAGRSVACRSQSLQAAKTVSGRTLRNVFGGMRTACWPRCFNRTPANAIHSIEQARQKGSFRRWRGTQWRQHRAADHETAGEPARGWPQLIPAASFRLSSGGGFGGPPRLDPPPPPPLVRDRGTLQMRAVLCNESSKTTSRKCCAG